MQSNVTKVGHSSAMIRTGPAAFLILLIVSKKKTIADSLQVSYKSTIEIAVMIWAGTFFLIH